MTRNLRTPAVMLTMAFAFALIGSTASAAEHHVNGTVGYGYTVVDNGPQVFTPTTGGTEGFTCKEISVKGKVEASTATSVTVEPSYKECETHSGISATVNMENCHFTFRGLTTTGNPTGGEHANVEIRCGETTEVVTEFRIRVAGFACVGVPSQTIRHAVRYTGTGASSIEIEATAHGFTSTTEGVCKNKESPEEVEGKQTHTNGVYTGDLVVDTLSGISLATTP